jgi:hypothetical protein
MTGFTTDYINQIAINLRDRYKSGFPILKELVQNADDAGARSLAFGFHPGHGDSADHMLLKGPALWVLNDGLFQPQDRKAIRSFGLNAKAGDSGVIGKFGLGMKSVFHLCESFFYLASQEGTLISDFLNPWRAEDYDSSEMHCQWETVTERDISCIEKVATEQPETSARGNWFLLWIPLRRRSHVPKGGTTPTAAIIESYPGDDPAEDLDFVSDPKTDQRIGALLPLLRNLQQVRFAGAHAREPFTVTLESQPTNLRLDHATDGVVISGAIKDDRLRMQHLHFLALQRVPGSVEPFVRLQAAKSWPTSMVITENGTREPRPDKAVAEAAVMFSHADNRAGKLELQWAVFLPAEEQRFGYKAWIPDSAREYRIVLHGQFFVDAGRRGISDMESLGLPREEITDSAPQHVVLRSWNQALTQSAVLPELLPTLAKYVASVRLKDDEIAALTKAITECAAAGDIGVRHPFFSTFRVFICAHYAWMRTLEPEGARWRLVEHKRECMLPLPAPPPRDPGRPWRVLPGLESIASCAFVDAAAPRLSNNLSTWDATLLLKALQGIVPDILKSETDLDYLASFLEMESARYVRTNEVQDELINLLRKCLDRVRLDEVRKNRKIFKRVVTLLSPERIFVVGTQDTAAKGALSETLYRTLLSAATRALPLPGDLGPDSHSSAPSEADLAAWLGALARHPLDATHGAGVTVVQMLDAADRVIRAAGDESRQISLLRRCRGLNVLRTLEGSAGNVGASSLDDLIDCHAKGWLFRTTDPNRPLGNVPKLAAALPEINSLVVRPPVAALIELECAAASGKIPGSEDAESLFRTVGLGLGSAPPKLGTTKQRADLLALVATAKLEDERVVRGVRFLLHGSPEHYLETEVLWKDPVGRNSPWVRLWQMIDANPWRVLSDMLCESIPDMCARALNIKAVDERSVLHALRACTDFSRVIPTEFSEEEIDLILGHIDEEEAWRRLPLHRDFDGTFDDVQGGCYLGRDPQLPPGTEGAHRFIEPSTDRSHNQQQRRFLPAWGATPAASGVLSTEQPTRHWRYLMDLLVSNPTLKTNPPGTWFEKSWLPLQTGDSIALNSLIRIEGLDGDLRRLAGQCKYAYASDNDLSHELRAHPGYPDLLRYILSGKEALPILGQMMSDAGISIGSAAIRRFRDSQAHLSILVAIEALPAWMIIERAIGATSLDAVEKSLVPEVTKQLPLDLCHQVLLSLSRVTPTPAVRDAFCLYLEEWRASESASELCSRLPELHLLSEAGTWALAGELVAGVQGVMPEFVVSGRLLESLIGVVIDNRAVPTLDPSDASVEEGGSTEEELVRSLEDYFEPLASSSVRPAVGAVIGLFGEKVAPLAKNWLEPIAYGDYLAKLGWKDPGYEDSFDRRLKWMGNKSLEEALRTLTIRIAVLQGNQLTAKSLTGDDIPVGIVPSDKLTTLFVTSDRWHGYSCRVQMRPASVLLDKDPQEQRDILMRTAEYLLKDLYNQPHANLSELFALADEADQVTLDVARSLILEGLPQSLRSLPGVGKHPKLSQALAYLDETRRGAVSAKHAGRNPMGATQAKDKALADLASLVEFDEEVQSVVLKGIKARVTHNQYEVSSIPFELFQNADDAVIEMQHLQVADGREKFDVNAIGRFVVRFTNSSVRFIHWGRPVNYSGRIKNCRPEFANDLERMLMLGASWKDEDDGVTGKFGLGFKSVLLASSSPRVWSGDLSFDVVAGCLPRKWKVHSSVRRQLQEVEMSGQRALRATLIDLPLDPQISASEVTKRFAGLAGLLPVFARRIRSVEITDEVHSWRPRVLGTWSDCRVEAGMMALPAKTGHIHSRILILRAESGCAVLRIGATGVEKFEHEAEPAVPAIWVTAPTRGIPAKGVLLNARFQIDTGRATLAMGKSATQTNTKVSRSLAAEISPALVELFHASESDWNKLANELGCGPTVSAAIFWFTLWESLFGEVPGDNAAMDVTLVDGFVREVFRGVMQRTGKVPNGLPSDQSSIVEVRNLSLAINLGYLGGVLTELLAWPAFIAKYPVGGWCAQPVIDWFKRSELHNGGEIPSLGIEQVVAVLAAKRLPPEDIRCLTRIISAWPNNLGDSSKWRNELAGVELRSRKGGWVSARHLIRPTTRDYDLFSRFAPDNAVLRPEYTLAGHDFLVLESYLPHWQPEPYALANWCIRADTESAQIAVANWLIRHIYDYPEVVHQMKFSRDRGGWIFELTGESQVLVGLSSEERSLLLAVLGLSQDCPEEMSAATPDFDLEAIHGWWSDNGSKWSVEFDKRLWPSGFDKESLRVDEPHDRTAWMTLLSLGLFRRYGRVTDQQHRGFLEFLARKGWWQTICEVSPDLAPQTWLDVLKAYGEEQDTEPSFELWMDSFPRLYRVARWLDSYVHLFQTLDQRDPVQARSLLSPTLDPSLSGSGIEAPTLTRMLRLGQHLVIRELLRVGVLSSEVARELAFEPRSSIRELMASMGHPVDDGRGIYRVLVEQLGHARADFGGAYDIPLQLIATNAVARREALEWASSDALEWADEWAYAEGSQ